MKAKLPYTHRTGKQAENSRALLLYTKYICYTLHREFGFGTDRLNRFLAAMNGSLSEVADYQHGTARNKTWQDELDAWAKKMNLNL